jgi:hypothetical protein
LTVIEPPLKLEHRICIDVIHQVLSVKAEQASNSEPTLHTAVSVAAVHRWLREYVRSGRDLRALIPVV